MILQLNLQSPYNPDGSPRQDLPTGEVLAWDGDEWGIGVLRRDLKWIALFQSYSNDIVLQNVVWFAPLLAIYEDDTTTL